MTNKQVEQPGKAQPSEIPAVGRAEWFLEKAFEFRERAKEDYSSLQEKHLADDLIEKAIWLEEAAGASKPVSVSLEKCALAAEPELPGAYFTTCEKVAKAVLDAAGVKYHED